MTQSKADQRPPNPFRELVRAEDSSIVKAKVAGCVVNAMMLVQAEGRAWTKRYGQQPATRNELLKTLNRSLISNGCNVGRANTLSCGMPLRQVRGLILSEVTRIKDKIRLNASPETASVLGLGSGLRAWKEEYRSARALKGEVREQRLQKLFREIAVVETETAPLWGKLDVNNYGVDYYKAFMAYRKGVELLAYHGRQTLRTLTPKAKLQPSVMWDEVEREYIQKYPKTVWMKPQSVCFESEVYLPQQLPLKYAVRCLLEGRRYVAKDPDVAISEKFTPDVTGPLREVQKAGDPDHEDKKQRAHMACLKLEGSQRSDIQAVERPAGATGPVYMYAPQLRQFGDAVDSPLVDLEKRRFWAKQEGVKIDAAGNFSQTNEVRYKFWLEKQVRAANMLKVEEELSAGNQVVQPHVPCGMKVSSTARFARVQAEQVRVREEQLGSNGRDE